MSDLNNSHAVIIGTAGHIDHGKSSLVRALTGTDPDRLKEEKERGITIELGYAFLTEDIAIIDVPGHEKFIRQMVAGAATIDLGLLVIAADDGIMPQTREHLEILDLLGISGGLVAISKADLIEPEWLEIVVEETKRLIADTVLRDASVIVVDSLSGRGIDELRAGLLKLANAHSRTTQNGPLFMPIDRVFTMKGFGTVVTGSILSGVAIPQERVQLMPARFNTRIKGIQSHGEEVEHLGVGQRAALNLHGVKVEQIKRGDVLAAADTVESARRLDIHLRVLKRSPVPVTHRQRVRLHVGTAEVMARVVLLECDECQAGETTYAQLILEEPVSVRRGDRFVMRRYSPQRTIAGGVVLDPNPATHRRNRPALIERLRQLQGDTPEVVLAGLALLPFESTQAIARRISLPRLQVQSELEKLAQAGQAVELAGEKESRWVLAQWMSDLERAAEAAMESFHATHPVETGMRRGEFWQALAIKVSEPVRPLLADYLQKKGVISLANGDRIARAGHSAELDPELLALAETVRASVEAAGFKPLTSDELATQLKKKPKLIDPIVRRLQAEGALHRLEGNLLLGELARRNVVNILLGLFKQSDAITLSQVREALDTSRKYALPIMSYCDDKGLTLRDAELRRMGAALKALIET
jgi:selenocysteine-specific elongation factor